MDVANITNAITTVGFPIACCLICFWYINKKDESHKNEVSELRKAVENNTLVLQKLLDKLGGENK